LGEAKIGEGYLGLNKGKGGGATQLCGRRGTHLLGNWANCV